MIPNNLKIGDTFKDGNRTFEIIGLSPIGYISKCVKVEQVEFATITTPDVKVPEKEEEITKDDVKLDSFNEYTKTEIKRLNVAELEKLCDKFGLEKSTRSVMIDAVLEKLGL